MSCDTEEEMDIPMMTEFLMDLASSSQRTQKKEEGTTEVENNKDWETKRMSCAGAN